MKPRNLTLLLLLLSAPVWGQSSETEVQTARPLNLSLPREAFHATPPRNSGDTGETVMRNLRPEPSNAGRAAGHLPYGTGFEARQRGMASGGRGAGGRGGMGRGR